MRVLTSTFLVAAVIALTGGLALAVPTMSATSTATQLPSGWYRYDIHVVWDLGQGLSHWDVILKPGCAEPDHLIVFAYGPPPYDGYSNNGSAPISWPGTPPTSWDFGWQGFFDRDGDTSVDPAITDPVVKFNNPQDLDTTDTETEPGPQAYGTFTFYSNIIPEYGTYTGAVVGKAGQSNTWGDLEGAYPSCSIIPAPGAILLGGIGVGLVGWLRRRRTL